MTVQELAFDMLKEQGEGDQNPILVEVVENFVRDTYESIVSFFNFSFAQDLTTLNLLTGVFSYELPATVRFITSIQYQGEHQSLTFRPRDLLVMDGSRMDQVAKPLYWYWVRGTTGAAAQQMVLGVWPVPDKNYTIDVIQFGQPARLARADVIPVPYDFIHLMREGVRALMREDEGNHEGAVLSTQRVHQALAKLISRWKHDPAHWRRLRVTDIYGHGGLAPVRLDPDHYRNF